MLDDIKESNNVAMRNDGNDNNVSFTIKIVNFTVNM